MKKIVFFGDSITDAGRTAIQNDCSMGTGYPMLIKAYLDYKYVGEYECFNKGISGNRIVDLYARIKKDVINLKPDYVSILIGVNDVWHEVDWNNGVSTNRFEQIYRMIIEDIKNALPDTKIFIMEPYILKGSATASTEERWDAMSTGVAEKAAVALSVANKFGLPFIGLQEKLEKRAENTAGGSVSADGVHPSTFGHAIIAKEWIDCFEKNK